MTEQFRIAIVGAGAIGGWFGARLSNCGYRVSALARTRTLMALREHGFRLTEGGTSRTAPVVASDDASELGVQDIVLLTVKGPSLAEVAARIEPMLGPDTVVISAMNGVPWWFLESSVEDLEDRVIRSIDPNGAITQSIPVGKVVGCVIHAACVTSEPGNVTHKMGNDLIIGEPSGGGSKRLEVVADVFTRAGFDVTVSSRIQNDIWYKLWGNMTMNPISALTGATCDRILDDSLVNGFVLQVMSEAAAVGRRIGCPISESGEDRNKVTRKLGAFKTSMLQDAEAGKLLEIDALLSAPNEIAKRVGIATPCMDALLGLTRLFAHSKGLYGA